MVFERYSFPNPNDRDDYHFTSQELITLLDKVYQNGWDHARAMYDPAMQPIITTSASYIEDKDDPNRWYTINI